MKSAVSEARLRQDVGKKSQIHISRPSLTRSFRNGRVRRLSSSVTFPLASPARLKAEIPLSETAAETVAAARETISDILAGRDSRLLVVTGPCSIHDEAAALEYAARLRDLREEIGDTIFPVMRVYLEKPRTTVGWKGLISDPRMDGSGDMAEGLKRARRLLLTINEMGIPAATEFLDPTACVYISDLVSWAAIGARTSESQTHRQMVSGLSLPVGFKNGTDGNLTTAVNAMDASSRPQCFTAVDDQGRAALCRTSGNPRGHIILRGGSVPNYDPASIGSALDSLHRKSLLPAIVVDCSHGNSGKDYRRQSMVFHHVIRQRLAGEKGIVGLMLESHLHEGSQPMPDEHRELEYGVSVTDACISWEETHHLLLSASELLKSDPERMEARS